MFLPVFLLIVLVGNLLIAWLLWSPNMDIVWRLEDTLMGRLGIFFVLLIPFWIVVAVTAIITLW